MDESLQEKLVKPISTEEFVKLLNSDDNQFSQAVEFAVLNLHPEGWRASWVLNHCITKNDKRLIKSLNKLIGAVKGKGDGHQRELLKLVEMFELDEEQEGQLFDICLSLWEDIYKSPSVRITAFRLLVKIVKQYPELVSEIEHLTQDHYTESLSSGVKKQFEKLKSEIGLSNY